MRTLAVCLFVSSCGCDVAPVPPPVDPVGQIGAVPVEGGFDLELTSLERPIRALQVDVVLDGARATAARQLSGADIVETSLGSDFTVVVSDTRRLNLPPGGVVHVDTDGAPSAITLTNAFAVDDLGTKRTVEVVTQ